MRWMGGLRRLLLLGLSWLPVCARSVGMRGGRSGGRLSWVGHVVEAAVAGAADECGCGCRAVSSCCCCCRRRRRRCFLSLQPLLLSLLLPFRQGSGRGRGSRGRSGGGSGECAIDGQRRGGVGRWSSGREGSSGCCGVVGGAGRRGSVDCDGRGVGCVSHIEADAKAGRGRPGCAGLLRKRGTNDAMHKSALLENQEINKRFSDREM